MVKKTVFLNSRSIFSNIYGVSLILRPEQIIQHLDTSWNKCLIFDFVTVGDFVGVLDQFFPIFKDFLWLEWPSTLQFSWMVVELHNWAPQK